MNCIEIKKLTKNYSTVCALNNVSLTIEENKIYGLLGRNGAGKTTLLNIINNRLFYNDGEVLLNGVSVTENEEAQRQFYLMSEENYYPESMKIKEIFDWTAQFYPGFDLPYAKQLADLFQLNLRQKVKSLSTGYTSIFKLIIALSVNVPFVFFDEPVLGLDANHRDLFYRLLIERYSEHPAAYVISTHLIEEVANVIEDVIIIKDGHIACMESKEKFIARAYSVAGPVSSVDSFIKGQNVIGTEVLGGLKVAYVIGLPPSTVPADLTIATPDLQKLFIQITNLSN